MSQLLDEECFESLAYERSKIWSNFLTRTMLMDDGPEIDLDNIDELFKNEDEIHKNYDEDIPEEAVEDNVVEDIKNTTMTKNKAELTIMLCNSENQQRNIEMEEILNETVPVFKEHARKWKEAGFERILNTFDADKIEKNVGHWLRRNNSNYIENSPDRPDFAKPSKNRHKFTNGNHIYSDSDSESVDTTHDIRTSRKHRSIAKYMPVSTSKMDGTVPCKRDEMHYGYEDYEDKLDYCRNMREFRHRGRYYRNEDLCRRKQYSVQSPPRYSHSVYSASRSNSHQRRKPLLPLYANSSMYSTSSSEDDYNLRGSHCKCRSCVKREFARADHHRHAHPSRHQLTESSKSLECTRSVRFRRNVRQYRRQQSFDAIERPRILESECSCCVNDKLCSNVVHVVHSSTEEWVVENSQSPEHIVNQKNTPKKNLKLGRKMTTPIPKYDRQPLRETTMLNNKESDSVQVSSVSKKQVPKYAATPKLKLQKAMSKMKLPQISEGSLQEDIENAAEPIEDTIIMKTSQMNISDSNKSKKGESKNDISYKNMKLSTQKTMSVAKRDDGDEILRKETTQLIISASKKPKYKGKLTRKSDSSLDEDMTEVKRRFKRNELTLQMKCNEIQKASGKKSKETESLLDESSDQVAEQDKDSPQRETMRRTRNNDLTLQKKRNTMEKPSSKKSKKAESLLQLSSKARESPDMNKLTLQLERSAQIGTNDKKSKEQAVLSCSNSDCSGSSDEMKKAIALSKQAYKKECAARLQKEQTKEGRTATLPESKVLFNNQSVSCNSTALANDTASAKTLNNRKRTVKRAAAVSTSQSVINISSSSASSNKSRRADDADCTAVTSTTVIEAATATSTEATNKSTITLTEKGILLHTPNAANSGNFVLTEQVLGSVVGELKARKYLKYCVGSRSFDSRYSVYYRPPPRLAAALSVPETSIEFNALSSSSSDSDDDVFEHLQRVKRYGNVYAALDKPTTVTEKTIHFR